MLLSSYTQLPEQFYQRIKPTAVSQPSLIYFNTNLAQDLGLTELDENLLAEYFSGNRLLEDTEPIAQAYAGHQFGGFSPQLGDGRAILLGEALEQSTDPKDIQLKGSGRTKFSRGGDGRATLGSVIRECIVSEAMHALGLPTTRSLAIVSTGEEVYREQGALPGAILTRVASSYVRVGTFEYFAAQGDFDSVQKLADYVIARHFPEIQKSEQRYLKLFEAVSLRQAKLIAQWMSIGFIHGVMNTDNTSICGETIDYGPCAFMDFYDPATVFSSIDHQGRYAYHKQANICAWNLSRLARTLVPIVDDDQTQAVNLCNQVLESYRQTFITEFRTLFAAKIGIKQIQEGDDDLGQDLLNLMHQYRADFSLSFRYLAKLLDKSDSGDKFFGLFDNPEESKPLLETWLEAWQERLGSEDRSLEEIAADMNKINPAFIPRNHRVEAAIEAAYAGDYSAFEEMLTVLAQPYTQQEEYLEYMQCPSDKEQNYVTFCGT